MELAVLDEPAKDFVSRGMSRRAAKALSRLLRGDVANAMCLLLPDVQYSSAPGTLVVARTELATVLPELTRRLVPDMVGMDTTPGWADAAEIPLVWLEAVNHELISRARHDLARAGMAAAARPRPSGLLVEARAELGSRAVEELARLAGPEQARRATSHLGGQLRDRIDNAVETHQALAQEWTGWALLAAAEALRINELVLPVPGHGSHDISGILTATAYRTGHALVSATAIALITMAENRH
jgi:hypothetical protein